MDDYQIEHTTIEDEMKAARFIRNLPDPLVFYLPVVDGYKNVLIADPDELKDIGELLLWAGIDQSNLLDSYHEAMYDIVVRRVAPIGHDL